MARSRSKAPNGNQPSGGPVQDLWRRGITRLTDQGKLMWLLGEGLNAALSAQARGWSPTDEQAFVSACYQWIQRGPGSSESFGSERPEMASPAAPQKHSGLAVRPQLDLRKASLSELQCPVLFIGSRRVGKSWSSLVIGVGLDGFRRVLSLKEGSVRERSVADSLLEELAVRGLSAAKGPRNNK